MSYPSLAALTPERTAVIANSARAWLASLLERIPPRGDVAVRALSHVLIAYWIADSLAPDKKPSSPGFTEVAKYVARSLTASTNSTHVDAVKPTLKLLVDVLLCSEGLVVGPFREFLNQSVSILRRADPWLEADPSLMDKRILLYSAGILPKPPAASADGVRVLLDKFRLSASNEEIDALILQLECLTGWGTQLIDDALIAPSLGEILAGLIVHRLRNYDLISAARLLRLQKYLASSRMAPERVDLCRVLCMHHRTQGPFGWYGPEAAMLRQLDPVLTDDTEFYLPTTLECLWTLAERSVAGWVLFGCRPESGWNSVWRDLR